MVDVDQATEYFTKEVLHAEEWHEADEATRQKALKNAENQLNRIYRKKLPDIAVYEQALWLLRIDETIRKSEQGVTSVSVSGININISRVNLSVAPEVINIMGRRIGRGVI